MCCRGARKAQQCAGRKARISRKAEEMVRRVLQLIAPGRPKELNGTESWLIYSLAAVTCSVFVAVAVGYYIDAALLMYGFLGVVLAVSFLTITGNPRRPLRGSWFGRAAAVLSLAIAIYFIVRNPFYATRLPMVDELSSVDEIAGLTAILLILEATRRVIGFTLVVVVLIFLATESSANGYKVHSITVPCLHRRCWTNSFSQRTESLVRRCTSLPCWCSSSSLSARSLTAAVAATSFSIWPTA